MNTQSPPAQRRVSERTGERDSSQGRSSIASGIQSQNSTPLSSLYDSRVADMTQNMTSTPSATQRRSINSPTTTPGTCSGSTPAAGRTSQTDSMRRVVSSPTCGYANNPAPLSGLENLPTPLPNPEAHAIITNPPRMRANRNESETDAGIIATSGGVNTSISGHRHSQHTSNWSLRYDTSCICNELTAGALHLEMTVVYECKPLSDGELCDAFQKHSLKADTGRS